MPKIIPEKCPQNHPCPSVGICPLGALIQENFKVPSVNETKCIECNKCVKFCPKGAIKAKS